MDKEKIQKAVSEENIYCLNGRVPVKRRFRSDYSMFWQYKELAAR